MPMSAAMDAAQCDEILTRYRQRAEHFESLTARRPAVADVIPMPAPFSSPTAREIEVLQLVSEGLVNREIGDKLFLPEETVKSHERHILANLQARSRAHAVAVGFRRGLLT